MKHVTVYSEPGIYAAWPANHGAWQWGDHMLVGFLRGPHERGAMHNIGEPFELMQARSLNGGETWTAENPQIPVVFTETRTPPLFSLRDTIIRVRGTYDHGGDDVPADGGFWLSRDRGETWHGAYGFDGLAHAYADDEHLTARTCVLGDMVFLSKARREMWGTDEVFCARHDGERFILRSTVCADSARAVMPAVAKAGERVVVAMRRRKHGRSGGWIDAYGSDDGCRTWRHLSEIGVTGRYNGNPPALIADGKRLVAAYGNRDDAAILARESLDGGETWSVAETLRAGGRTDIGYPQLFRRESGELVCVYYWADKENPVQHIEATVFR